MNPEEEVEILVLENGEEYLVVDSFIINNRKYVFLIGEKEKDLALVEMNNGRLKHIDSDEEYNEVFNLLYERNKDKIEELNEKD